TDDGSARPHIRRLLDAGVTVVGVDLLYQGEFLADRKPLQRQRCLPNEEGYAGWTYCYNLPVFAHRVHDILAVMAFVEADEIDAVGLNGAGHLATAAVAQAKGAVARAAIDTEGFRFADLEDVYDVDFMSGAAKYDDLPGLLALAAPTQLWLTGEGKEAPLVVKSAFAAADKAEKLTQAKAKRLRWLSNQLSRQPTRLRS
ncbi:MAG: hypothetical protein ACYTBS_25330, partial [Planctomycetota bacterium]